MKRNLTICKVLLCAVLFTATIPVAVFAKELTDENCPVFSKAVLAESKMTITTSKSVGQTLSLTINALAEEQGAIWIDLNNDAVKDANENVVFSNTKNSYTIGSQTITIYGNVDRFECDNNSLTVVDVTENNKLTHLRCHKNNLKSLDITQNIDMTILYCNDNSGLGSIDVSNNTKLVYLSCSTNGLTELDITNNPNLTMLHCYNNQIASLDLTNNTKLNNVRVFRNNLTACALDNMYKTLSELPTGTRDIFVKYSNSTSGHTENPGADESRHYIATNKGWLPKDYSGAALANTSYTCIETAIEDAVLYEHLLLYPNPSKDFVALMGLKEPVIVTIYNLQGKSLMIELIDSDQAIDISNLPQGIYIMRAGNQSFKLIRE